MTSIRLGLTLPSFVEDPEIVLRVAAAAEAAGVDGVFVYDHLFRIGKGGRRRPALESTTLLGAVLASTSSIKVGTLVTRATLRPPAVLAHAFDTAIRIAPGRLIATIGAGDGESREEMETFGYDFGTARSRVDALAAAVAATRGRGYPVWIGGTSVAVRALAAATADGWNRWGGTPASFAAEAASLGSVPEGFCLSWGGLVVLGATDDEATEKAERLGAPPTTIVGSPSTLAGTFREYVAAGAQWVILGPIDSENPDNAAHVAAIRSALESASGPQERGA